MFKKLAATALAALFLATASSSVFADIHMPHKPNFYDKLGYGIANIIYAPAEILDSTYEMTRRGDDTEAFSKGIVQGFSRMIMDMSVGIFEVATSPYPSQSIKMPAYDSGVVEHYPPASLRENWY